MARTTFGIHKRYMILPYTLSWGFPVGTVVKNLSGNAEDTKDEGTIPRSGRSLGEANGYPIQYSSLGNLMDIEA